MKITRENYEAFFLDYHEGQLGESQRQDVLLFLQENPDLRAEFDAFEIIEVTPPAQTFSGKESLKKKGITVDNYLNYFVAYHEGDLSSSGRKEVEQFAVTSPELAKELELFGKLKLAPDPKIIFKHKKGLHRQAKVIQLNRAFIRYAAAAVLALLILTYFYTGNRKEPVFSQKDSVKPAPVLKNKEKQFVPAGDPAPATVAANESKHGDARRGPKQSLTVQKEKNAEVQPQQLTANTATTGKDSLRPSPVSSPATTHPGNFDSSLAFNAGNTKGQETPRICQGKGTIQNYFGRPPESIQPG
jgi:hypothetical protein